MLVIGDISVSNIAWDRQCPAFLFEKLLSKYTYHLSSHTKNNIYAYLKRNATSCNKTFSIQFVPLPLNLLVTLNLTLFLGI